MKMFKSMKELLKDACEENGNTQLQEILGCISFVALIPAIWLFLYAAGCR